MQENIHMYIYVYLFQMLTFFCKKFEMQQNRREAEIAAKKFEMACIASENARLAVCFYPVVLFAHISFTGVCMSECVYLRTVGLCPIVFARTDVLLLPRRCEHGTFCIAKLYRGRLTHLNNS
jgi:hypothetical protein